MPRSWIEKSVIRRHSKSLRQDTPAILAACEPDNGYAGLNESGGGRALVLTHKLAARSGGRRAASAARFAWQSAEFPDWVDAFKFDHDNENPFRHCTIVAEDASPDTCLALVGLARRVAGLPIADAWFDYSDRWEGGDTTTTGAPEFSWGALHQALVHPLFSEHAAPDVRENGFAHALAVGCTFVEGLIAANMDPAHVTELAHSDVGVLALLLQARSHLRAERAIAEKVAEIGEVVQLALEIPNSKRRRLLDGIVLTEERHLTSSLKVFLRTTSTSPSGEGYRFLALHRPLGTGSGNDMTFSVDPAAGVWLREAWEELERAEWRLWRDERSQRAPRSLASYERSDLPHDIKPCDEPWYDGHPLYTMVCAPRRTVPDNQPGSRLQWPEALQIVWQSANPLRFWDLRVRSTGQPADLTRWPAAEHFSPSVSTFPVADVVVGPEGDRTILFWSDTVARSLAAWLATGSIAIVTLPRREDLRVVRGRGGAIVISACGAAIVDMAQDPSFPVEELRKRIAAAADLVGWSRKLEKKIELAREKGALAIASGAGRERAQALGLVLAIARAATARSGFSLTRSTDSVVAGVEDALEDRWGGQARFQAVLNQAKELREMIMASSELRTNELIHAIAVFGFPFALLVNLFSFGLQGLTEYTKPWIFWGINLAVVAGWLVTSLVVVFGLAVIAAIRNRVWRAKIEGSDGEL